MSKDDEEGRGCHCSYQIALTPPAMQQSQVPKVENGTSWVVASLGVGGGGGGGKPILVGFTLLDVSSSSYPATWWWRKTILGCLGLVLSEISHKWDYCCKSRPRTGRQRPNLMLALRFISTPTKCCYCTIRKVSKTDQYLLKIILFICFFVHFSSLLSTLLLSLS